MKIRTKNIVKTYTNKTIRISPQIKANQDNRLLYLQSMKIREAFKIPAVVSNNGIDFPNVPLEVMKALDKLGIKYQELIKRGNKI